MPDVPYFYALNIPTSRLGLTAERYMLRQSGDWRGYMAMMDSGAIETTPFLRGMVNYYAKCIESFKSVKPINSGLLAAVSVWNDEYLNRFLKFCLPSLLEKTNLAALKARGAGLFIHTDGAGRDIITAHPIINEFLKNGITVQMMLLDDNVLERVAESMDHKYWHLGMTQSLHLEYARALNVDYHLLMPDVMYCAGFFDRLLNLGKPVITHSSLPTDAITIEPVLETYRDGVAINIDAPKLIALSVKHAHARILPYFLGENRKWPKGHVLVFEGKDTIRLMSPHQTLAFVAKEVIAKVPERFYFTLDSEIEKIIGASPIYSPTAADGLAMLEISGNIPYPARSEVATVTEYCKRFLNGIPEKGLHNLFLAGMSMPIERAMLADRWYMEEAEIDAMQRELRIALASV